MINWRDVLHDSRDHVGAFCHARECAMKLHADFLVEGSSYSAGPVHSVLQAIRLAQRLANELKMTVAVVLSGDRKRTLGPFQPKRRSFDL